MSESPESRDVKRRRQGPLAVLAGIGLSALVIGLAIASGPAAAVDCLLNSGDGGSHEKTCTTTVRTNFAELAGVACYDDPNAMDRLEAFFRALATGDFLHSDGEDLLADIVSESEDDLRSGLESAASDRQAFESAGYDIPDQAYLEVLTVAASKNVRALLDDLSIDAQVVAHTMLRLMGPDGIFIHPDGLSRALANAFGAKDQRILVELAPGQQETVTFDNCYRLDVHDLVDRVEKGLAARGF